MRKRQETSENRNYWEINKSKEKVMRNQNKENAKKKRLTNKVMENYT